MSPTHFLKLLYTFKSLYSKTNCMLFSFYRLKFVLLLNVACSRKEAWRHLSREFNRNGNLKIKCRKQQEKLNNFKLTSQNRVLKKLT